MAVLRGPSEAGTTVTNKHGEFLSLLNRLNSEFNLRINTDEQIRPRELARTAENRCRTRGAFLFQKQREQFDHCVRSFRSLERQVQTAQALLDILENAIASSGFLKPALPLLSASTATSFGSNPPAIFSETSNSGSTSFTDVSPCSRSPSDNLPPLFVSTTSVPDLHNEMVANFTSMSASFPSVKSQPENYRLRTLPGAGFFCSDLPSQHHDLPLRVRHLCQSVACHYGLVLPDLNPPVKRSAAWHDLDWLWKTITSLIPQTSRRQPGHIHKPSQKTWNALAPSASLPHGLIMSASLEPLGASKAAAAFKLVLNPLAINDKSNRFARKFGAHRFLKLLVPTSSDIPKHLQGKEAVEERLQQWLNAEHKPLLGYKWSALFNKPAKATEKKRKKFGHDGRREVMFFATSGAGLEPISRDQILNWFLPMRLNPSMPYCKAYARLELGFSTTFPTLVFNPSQIIEVDDILADASPEDKALNDPHFDWTDVFDTNESRVMNDGCCTMSHAAARIVWDKYLHQTGHIPSAFQARIGPWKGIWSVEKCPRSEADEADVWIKVCPSQTKFKRHIEDLGDQYDPLRLTFEVLEWSRSLSSSKLYIDHLPILENRGVERSLFEKAILAELAEEEKKASKAWLDNLDCLEWLQRECPASSENADGTDWSGLRKKSKAEMARTMLNSGFSITEDPYLMELMKLVMRWHFNDLSESLNIPVAKSTMAIGVADPIGCLAPNEIHMGFSSSEIFGDPYLDDCDALVSRHPSLRVSDVQRVHVVFKRELMHLRDVVVFPTRGFFPLAGKLQGGDYDGDTFWVCWDRRFVENFRNAPPPAKPLPPEHFDISVDRTSCKHFLSSGPGGIQDFFGRSFRFQWQDSLLGICTSKYEQLRYTLGPSRTSDPRLKKLADIHDLIIDSSKNGYTFTQSSWDKQTADLPNTSKPWYKQPDKHKAKCKTFQSIVDFLMFDVAVPRCRKFLEDVCKASQGSREIEDSAVGQMFRQWKLRYNTHEEVLNQLQELEHQLKHPPEVLKGHFYSAVRCNDAIMSFDVPAAREKKEAWISMETEHLKWYNSLRPTSSCSPLVKQMWENRIGREGPSTWEFVKASALHSFWPWKQCMVFVMAGREICFLKSQSSKRAEPIVPSVSNCMKFKRKRPGHKPRSAGSEVDESSAEADDISGDGNEVQEIANAAVRAPKRRRCNKPPACADSASLATKGILQISSDADDAPTEPDTDSDADSPSDLETSYASAPEEAFVSVPEEIQSLSQDYSQLDIRDIDDMDDFDDCNDMVDIGTLGDKP